MPDRNLIDIRTVLASTVHDVKNSLGLINHQLEEIAKETQEHCPEASDKLQRIGLEAERINNGLVHMLGLYRMDEGEFEPTIEEVYVLDVVQDACSRYYANLEMLNIELEVTFEDEGVTWYFDPLLVEGIIANVLTNSIRYTDNKLSFNVSEEGGFLKIQIKDNGHGYPEHMLDCLTDKGDTNFKTGSTGLGLHFSDQIARMHVNNDRHGYVELTNDPVDGGALFSLYLP